MESKSLNILLIEDDLIEVMKFKRVVSTMQYKHKVIEASNGEEALEILKGQEIIPDIIILDLNMPKISGIQFLEILKADEYLRYIPAIVLSTSNNHSDLLKCYELGIAGYLVKPLKYEDYLQKIEKALCYWATNNLVSR